MKHPPNIMPDELKAAHYIAQILELEKENKRLRGQLGSTIFADRSDEQLENFRECLIYALGLTELESSRRNAPLN